MPHTQPDGYLAIPPRAQGSAVLVLHAWWGLNDTIKAFCTRLAESGFVAFAPDLYHGQVADNIADAETLAEALFGNLDQAKADIAEAAAYLNERAGQARPCGDWLLAGCLFCAGSLGHRSRTHPIRRHLLRDAARRLQQLTEQPTSVTLPRRMSLSRNPNVDNLEESLRRAGRPVTFYRYTGTGHWFFEPDRSEAYNQAAASLAWDRT